MTQFWRNWFTIWCFAIILFGVILAGAGLPATDGAATMAFALMGTVPGEWTSHLRFATGLMGAVTMGWGMTLLVATRAAIALGPHGAPVWRGLIAAAGIWFLIDSALSIANGFALNAASNLLFVVMLLIGIFGSGALSAQRPG